MSGQPAGDDAADSPTEPRWPAMPVWPDKPALTSPAGTAPAVPEPRGQLTGDGAPPDLGQSLSGALLPGEWARQDDPAGGQKPPSSRTPWWRRLSGRVRSMFGGELRGGRLAVVVSVIALACTMLGGVIGGYVALRAQNAQTDPS